MDREGERWTGREIGRKSERDGQSGREMEREGDREKE